MRIENNDVHFCEDPSAKITKSDSVKQTKTLTNTSSNYCHFNHNDNSI